MSAFVVDKRHIDALVTVAFYGPRLEVGIRPGNVWFRPTFGDDTLELEQLDELGQLLVDENLKSVHAKYPDTISVPESTPGPIVRYWERPYAYRISDRRPTAVEALKLVACYEYQSCEHDGWQGSGAQVFCERLRHTLIGKLPGYDDAAWEWTE